MALKVTYDEELRKIQEYLRSDASEDAKRPLVYPLFTKLFREKFKVEAAAEHADGYVEGKLVIECKTSAADWLAGFYQALHYAKKGLTFSTVCVIAKEFLAVWKVDKLPEEVVIYAHRTDGALAAQKAGKENARRTTAGLEKDILASTLFKVVPKDFQKVDFSPLYQVYAFLKLLNNLDSERIQINPTSFINDMELFKAFFESPIEAIHAFYTIVAYWDVTSTVAENEAGEVQVIGFRGTRFSDKVNVLPRQKAAFRKFVESYYVFTNEGSGLTVDYYFSRFDEAITRLNPEYARQHGIFFTEDSLSKFAHWFIYHFYEKHLSDKYIIFDPAGGSGNLISSWRGHLKHKIISELQPDLLRTIERRMRVDPFHLQSGFTVIPKTVENRGLNFLNCSVDDYLAEVKKGLREKQMTLDKPLAFLLNPPYKSTDENESARKSAGAHYDIHPDILTHTGDDAGKERYLAFLGQIINICNAQVDEHPGFRPLVMIFTPTSWLIPRPTYAPFRKVFDRHFQYEDGFIVTSNEFFKLSGTWPVAFTIWSYRNPPLGEEDEVQNTVTVKDLTHLTRAHLNINWHASEAEKELLLSTLVENAGVKNLSDVKLPIRSWCNQSMYDFKRDPTQSELKSGEIYGGLPLKDERRNNKKTYGINNSTIVGFMDNATPVRIKGRTEPRFINTNNNIWFRLDASVKDTNKAKCFGGPTDNRSYCAYDLSSAKATFTWFAIAKAINGRYPAWANQFDLWAPDIRPKLEKYFYSLCFAFVLAENRCVVTKFEAGNPVPDAPEVFVDNPLCPTNPESFWCTTLDKEIVSTPNPARALVDAIKDLYKHWNAQHCRAQFVQHTGLHEEPYFKHFNYPDFVTPYSGLIQIRKYADCNGEAVLLQKFADITAKTKAVREEIYRLLVDEFGYFE